VTRSTEPASLLAPLRARYPEVLARIEELVNIDSGSYTAEGVNRVADLCQARFEAGGWAVERHRHRPGPGWVGPPLGDLVVGRRAGGRPVAEGGRRLLLLAHMDTVFDKGTAAARPFRTRDGRAYGPGVTDDKAGVVCGFEALQALNGRWPGVTCNVGVLRGGNRTNVVADRAVMQVEVRAATTAAFDRAMAEVVRIVAATAVEGARAELLPAHRHPPMERTGAVAALVAEAQAVARGLGFEVGEAATGGAGDANTTAAAGLPTIDGLAPVGGEAHGPNEWLDLDSVVPRTALLAGLLARLGARG
jgi:acetylornithine deacetylase/succinyl-diaminopimelate desuccinylase-like protein